MKLYVILYFIFCIPLLAQNHGQKDQDSLFYPGTQDLTSFTFEDINTHIIFPREAAMKNIFNGSVTCKYAYDKYGNIINISCVKSSNAIFEKYAIEYLKKLKIKYTKKLQLKMMYFITLKYSLE
jgi:outer membrane biosynthesis protein TonB